MILNDKRLRTIADMLPECEIIADIGTDHGKIGCYLLETGRCKRLLFSDISRDSLEKARILAENMGLSGQAEFCLGDGAAPLPVRPDAAVIAGMGGITIAEIITGGHDKLSESRLVIEPNTHLFEARKALMDNGHTITDEKCVLQSGRHYVVICAKPGQIEYTFDELLAGPILLKDKSTETREYAEYRLKLAETTLKAQQNAKKHDLTETLREMEIWKQML